jgi:hypothetical protein
MPMKPTFYETWEERTDPETGKAMQCFTVHVVLPPRRRRKATLDAALRQAAKAGATVAQASLDPDGKAVLTFGSVAEGGKNEWDEE